MVIIILITFKHILKRKGECSLYNIYFYKDKNGKEPVLDYIRELKNEKSKDSRIKLKKIQDYIQILSEHGTRAGEPYIKHIDGEIWELRPLKDRIFFITWHNDGFILLHHFVKKSQKTPSREIEKAKREVANLKRRGF